MLIPSIDLQGGRVVQLEQGERVRYAFDDLDEWIERFTGFPIVQVIDLDAAKGTGANQTLVARVCAALPCQVGGGVRTPDNARALVEAGAVRVIAGSALFGPDGPRADAAERFALAVGNDRLIAAVDSFSGRVVTHGWRARTSVSIETAIRVLDPFAGGFLHTQVEAEGLLTGFDVAGIEPLRRTTTRRFIVAGGIREPEEIDALEAIGADGVVGMAIYSGLWPVDDLQRRRLGRPVS